MDADLADQTESTIPSETYSAPDQPYPGLRPFRENEQRLFFGRDRQIKEILQRLERSSFAVVIGGSGSGKSSIVNAGVIPSKSSRRCWRPTASPAFWIAIATTSSWRRARRRRAGRTPIS